MNNLLILKIFALIFIFAISLIFALGSLKFGSYFENSKWLSLFSMFAAGIFLSVTFLDLLPEAYSSIDNHEQILACLTKENNNSQIDNNCITKEIYPYTYLITMLTTILFLFLNKLNPHSHQKNQNFPIAQTVIDQLDTTLEAIQLPDTERRQQQQIIKSAQRKMLYWNYLILMIAIIIHAFFESLAIGILQEWGSLFDLTIAVLLHKWAEASIFGLFLYKYEFPKYLQRILLIVFLNTGPIGIILGYFLTEISNVFNGVILSICAGIFLYVGLIDIVQEEMADINNKKLKVGFFLLGVVLNIVVSLFN